MSHHIYHTKAYVIESTPLGEANKSLVLLTEDLGLITVSAQGVRLQKSKLKSSIQDYSFSNVSLVRGKEVWRLTNAQKLISLFDRRLPIEVRRLLVQCLQFIKRLTPREVQVKDVFELMSMYSGYCFENKDLAIQFASEIYVSFELRVLDLLGYGTEEELITKISKTKVIDSSLLDTVKMHRKSCDMYINQALHDSHL